MTKYKVKNFYEDTSIKLNNEVDAWIESREHIVIKNINIWYDDTMDKNCAKIVYIENIYVG